ncbi:MAG TPA: LruC domain-containing protein [Polyangia bacterium]|nr:LruC domain-containing protein [Polyangia bacterium]
MKRSSKLHAAALFAVLVAPRLARATSPTGETRPVPTTLRQKIGTILPEHSEVGSSFLSSAFDPNLDILQPATVKVTFISEGAGYLNTLGWFTFTNNDASIQILERGLIFPNASFADPSLGWGGGNLATGDAVTIRDTNGSPKVFQPGVKVGFFLVANGWNGSSVTGWNVASHPIPNVSPALNKVASGVFTTIDALNPEVANGHPDVSRHCAMLEVTGLNDATLPDPLYVVAFEDLMRDGSSDNDFNDVVFITEATPETAVQVNSVTYNASSPDPDSDGVSGLQDAFPSDPARATIQTTPPVGVRTLAFEDNYPLSGDRDYNDAVVQYAVDEVLAPNGKIKDIVGTFHLVARGAGYDHAFGVALPLATPLPTGQISIERFASDGTKSTPTTGTIASLVIANNGVNVLRIPDLFPSTRGALPPKTGLYTNTTSATAEVPPASVRFKITFDAPVTRASLGTPPYDPFLAVFHDTGRYDIHLPGKAAFADRPTGLPVEQGAKAFIDDTGAPFALEVPWNFQYPLEGIAVGAAFPPFATWCSSAGAQNTTWYQSPYAGSGPTRVSAPMKDASRNRAWTLQATQ